MTALTIRVRGSHQLELPAERAEVSLAATASGTDAATVTAGVSASASALRAALSSLEASGALERWSNERLSTWSTPAQGDGAAPNFTASISFTASFAALDALGPWLSDVAARPDIAVHGVQWRLTTATAERAASDAAVGAIAEAQRRAEHYARAAGRSAPQLLELADSGRSGGGPMPRMMLAANFDQAGVTGIDLRPAPVVVSAEVEAVFVSE